MEEYAVVTIKFYAPEEEINGRNEYILSNKVGEIEAALERWLKICVAGTKLTFKVSDQGEKSE